MKSIDTEYLRIVDKILTNGEFKDNRTGVRTIAIPGEMIQWNMQDGFPLLTTKKVPFKSIKVELEGFIKGITDKRWYQERGCNIWNEWANPMKAPYAHDDISKSNMMKENDLGKIYGYQWNNFGSQNKNIVSFIPRITTYKTTGKIELPEGKEQDKWYYFPRVCKVACVGELINPLNNEFEKLIYKNWYDMINRCFNRKAPHYYIYGGNGVTVCDRWLCFENYRKDITKLLRWQDKVREPSKFSLDKDYFGSSIYAPDTCVFLSREENIMYNNSSCYILRSDKEELLFLTKSAVSEFLGFTRKNLDTYLNKDKQYNGWRIHERKDDKLYRYQLPMNQIQNIVSTLKSNPNDRRMLCSAWNTSDFNEMALVPCHTHWQVTVINGKLNLMWYQRSVDTALGLPFNIASYATLLHLLAKESNLQEGTLTGFLADVHIYEPHIENLKLQLSRQPLEMPIIETKEFKSIFDWQYTDTQLLNYESHEKLSFEVAV